MGGVFAGYRITISYVGLPKKNISVSVSSSVYPYQAAHRLTRESARTWITLLVET